jgi:molybdopterin synthase sulfur carrier subunit
MTVTVQIPTALRRLTSGTGQVQCTAANVDELFSALDQQFPELKSHLRDESGQIRRFLNVYVNEEDIDSSGGTRTRFKTETRFYSCPRLRAGRRSRRTAGGSDYGDA